MAYYKFVNSFKGEEVNKEPNITYYHVAAFSKRDPLVNNNKGLPKGSPNGLYHVRKFIIDHNGEFINVKNYYVSKRVLVKLLKHKKDNQYKVFPVYDLNIIDYPTLPDILLMKSSLLSDKRSDPLGNHNYSGFAPIY